MRNPNMEFNPNEFVFIINGYFYKKSKNKLMLIVRE